MNLGYVPEQKFCLQKPEWGIWMILRERIERELFETEVEASVFDEYYDIVIVGLGTAGCISAIAAAKNGLKVLGIERLNCMGGQGTAGAVFSYYYGSSGGLFEDIDNQVNEYEKLGYTKTHGINPFLKKYVLETEALNAGVTISYEAIVTGVYLEGKKVIGVRWFYNGRFVNTGAKVIIDCTAEADICDIAGCETRMGRAFDNGCQPFSNVMVTLYGNETWCQFIDEGHVNQTDGDKLSEAIIETMTHPMHLREYFDPIDRVLYYTQHLGVREGRHIIGEETVFLNDFFEDRLTDKPLFYSNSNLDKHGHDFAFESDLIQEWTIVSGLWGINISVPIPMGAIIPKGYDGILAAARHLALDHDIATAVRMKKDMHKCGEAAAIVAYASIRNNCRLKDVSYDFIQPLLKENKCLNEENNFKMNEFISKKGPVFKNINWVIDKDELEQILLSEKPGIAIWSCRRIGAAISDELKKWLVPEEKNLSENSALALGLLGDIAALPILRKIVRERTNHTSEEGGERRGIAAIYLLGKLGDTDSVQELISILDGFNIEQVKDTKDFFLQCYIYAILALIKIGKHCEGRREEIVEAIFRSLAKVDIEPYNMPKTKKQSVSDLIFKTKEFTIKMTAEL